MRTLLILMSVYSATASASVETATVATDPPPTERLPVGVLDVRVGLHIPSVFNKLDTTFTVHAGAAWQFAFDRILGAFLDLSYAEPTARGARSDPRVVANGGAEDWTLAVRDFGIGFGPRVQFHLGALFDGYVGLGALVSFTRSVTSASAGDVPLGTHTEFNTRLGGLLRLGVGFKLGPGAVVLELAGNHVPVDHLITGDANTSSLSAQLGYAFYLK